MLTYRARTSAIVAAVVGLVVIAVLMSLPVAVRHFAVLRLEAMTGRPVTIRDVDLNLFTRHLVFYDVTIHSPADAAPLATASRIEVRFRITPLVRGRLHLDRLDLVKPAVVLVRHAPDRISVEDVVARWRAREAGEPVRAKVDRLQITHGQITFADFAVDPDRRWVVEHLAVEARNIATTEDAAAGRASAHFTVAGATAAVDISDLSVRPFHARAAVRLDGLDLSRFAPYFPGDAAIRLAGGRSTTRATLEYDARGFLRASADSTVRDLTLRRRGQQQPFVTAPVVALDAHDVTYTDTLNVGRLAISADQAVVLGAGRPATRRLTIRDLRFTFADRPVAATGPGRLALSAKLPADGAITAHGTGGIAPVRTAMTVELRGIDLARAAMWLPAGTAVTPIGGDLGGTLDVRYARDSGLTVGGRAWIDRLELARRNESTVILRDDRIEITATGMKVDEAGPALGHLELTASPSLVLRAGAAPIEVQSLRVTADGGGLHATEPTRVEGHIVLPYNGRITANGQVRLDTSNASFALLAAGIDVRLAAAYFPGNTALTIRQGRVDARLTAEWTGLLEVDGRVTVRRLTVQRAGQDPPLVEHARLDADVTDLRVGTHGLSVDRIAVTGAPVIVDGSALPPARFDLRQLELVARHVTWPARQPIEVAGHGEAADGGRVTVRGTVRPDTLATDVRVAFENVALSRASGYLPEAVPVSIGGGHAEGELRLRYARGAPIRVDGHGALVDLAATLTAARTQLIDDRATFSVDDVIVSGGAVTVGRAVVDGSPVLGRGGERAQSVAVHAEIRTLSWPGGTPARLAITVSSGNGRLEITGGFAPSTRTLDAAVRANDVALAPLAALLPIEAPIAGTLDADGRMTLHPGDSPGVVAHGALAVRDLRIGPEDGAPVRAAEVRLDGVSMQGHTIDVARITVAQPAVLIERARDGSFPLRAMLTPESSGQASPDTTSAPSPHPTGDASAEHPAPAWRVSVDDLRITDGSVRFIDRTTTPFYSEELTEVAVTIRDLANVAADHAGLMVQAVVGADAALDLRGEMAPFATPFFLEVSGELRNFAVPRTNPYLQRFLDWIARRGQLTTQVHYRIVGDELHGTNELLVHRLDVERARGADRTERLVGVPLGLAVALMKDAKGDIRFTLPVSGELGSPKFSFGDAIRNALSHVLGRLVTAPLRAISSVFRHHEGSEAVTIDPVTFRAGSAALTPDAAARLERLADVLRTSPYVAVRLEGLVSAGDLQALKTRQVIARIQRTGRSEKLDSFAEAARQVWQTSMPPGSQPPAAVDGIVRVLAAREPTPSTAARGLAERRENVTRAHLVDAAGIPHDRLLESSRPPLVGARGEGRVEFTLQPIS